MEIWLFEIAEKTFTIKIYANLQEICSQLQKLFMELDSLLPSCILQYLDTAYHKIKHKQMCNSPRFFIKSKKVTN